MSDSSIGFNLWSQAAKWTVCAYCFRSVRSWYGMLYALLAQVLIFCFIQMLPWVLLSSCSSCLCQVQGRQFTLFALNMSSAFTLKGSFMFFFFSSIANVPVQCLYTHVILLVWTNVEKKVCAASHHSSFRLLGHIFMLLLEASCFRAVCMTIPFLSPLREIFKIWTWDTWT